MAAIEEDSSRQDMKKNMRWERIEDAEGMRSRADLNREGFGEITPPPAEGSAGTFLIASTVKVLFVTAGARKQRCT